jgi:hypothetical protein
MVFVRDSLGFSEDLQLLRRIRPEHTLRFPAERDIMTPVFAEVRSFRRRQKGEGTGAFAIPLIACDATGAASHAKDHRIRP